MKAKARKIALIVALGNIVGFSSINLGETVMVRAEGEGSSIVEDIPSSVGQTESEEETIQSSEESGSGQTPAESSEGEASEEESEYWKQVEKYISDLEEQIKKLSQTKFLNGTIGGLVSSALTLLVYLIFKIADKKGWKSRTELFTRANGLLDSVSEKVEDLHKTEALTEEQYKTATKAIESASTFLNETNAKLDESIANTDKQIEELKSEILSKYNETLEQVTYDYEELLSKYNTLIAMLKEMAKGSPDLVKSGTYQKITEIEGKGE